ncbi:hypothetical protein EJ078_10885 [Mesorhizobium sp. M1A.F.Ca.IN.022.06.1.1]|uniref:hypothetical protein n=1 Tax=Mesorhizobium sp. M1A.F.Ca.IN.022.06.1.1 TaxID=2493680 RepID=UPI000F763C84|nr:hypothetical protein [Mesorhizobium sp. M1A.F.Ca.IN.022.06.1.1]AZO59684.1 hypothetical protein EJ078_10885 [Mesorhizobium sp. M1A.F.Ca.IN.022.06.1.1]
MAARSNRMLARWEIAALGCALIPFLQLNARANDLTGFAEFPFGITADQLKDKIDVFESDSSGDGVEYFSKRPRNINGKDFTINFLFRNEKLKRINLDYSRNYPKDSMAEKCTGDFAKITQEIQDKYHITPQLMNSEKATFFASRFEFSHNSRISVYHMILDDRGSAESSPECVVRVEYLESAVRNEF